MYKIAKVFQGGLIEIIEIDENITFEAATPKNDDFRVTMSTLGRGIKPTNRFQSFGPYTCC